MENRDLTDESRMVLPASRTATRANSSRSDVVGAFTALGSGRYLVEMSALPVVEVLVSVTDADASDLEHLLGQLSATAIFDRARLATIVTHDATELLVVRDGGRIVGAATLVTFPLPSGVRGHVDDVVVDEAMRGKGIARALLLRMTELATDRGLRTLDLTSRPSRESALRLYESVGFVPRETNVLRFTPPALA